MRPGILAVSTIMLFSGASLACSCADVTPRSCNLLADHEVSIFVGTVASVENPPKEGDNQGGTARYWIAAKRGGVGAGSEFFGDLRSCNERAAGEEGQNHFRHDELHGLPGDGLKIGRGLK